MASSPIKLILKDLKTKQTHLVKDSSVSFITPYGKVSKEQLQDKTQTIVQSDKKRRFAKFEPTFKDLKDNLLRAPQIMQDKDIGLILATTGINKESVVIDAGAGSGALTLSLANIAKQVTSIDTNNDHLKVVKKNAHLTGLNNVALKRANVSEELQDTKTYKNNSVDLITLDMPTPWETLEPAARILKQGAHLVIYLPNIMQVQTTLNKLQEIQNLTLVELTELQKRDWKVQIKKELDQSILRPEHTQNVHTGFLLFIRKF